MLIQVIDMRFIYQLFMQSMVSGLSWHLQELAIDGATEARPAYDEEQPCKLPPDLTNQGGSISTPGPALQSVAETPTQLPHNGPPKISSAVAVMGKPMQDACPLQDDPTVCLQPSAAGNMYLQGGNGQAIDTIDELEIDAEDIEMVDRKHLAPALATGFGASSVHSGLPRPASDPKCGAPSTVQNINVTVNTVHTRQVTNPACPTLPIYHGHEHISGPNGQADGSAQVSVGCHNHACRVDMHATSTSHNTALKEPSPKQQEGRQAPQQ